MKKFLLLITLMCLAHVVFMSRSVAFADTLTPEEIIEKEKRITENISEQVERQISRVRDSKIEKKLSAIAERIKPYMERDLNYEVRIIKRNDPHSFSLPGGLTYITTGMLNFLKSDDEIAAVLAREFIHADLSHWLIQSARNEKIDFQTMANIAAATQNGKVAGNFVKSYFNRAVINFYDLDLEEETDLKAPDVLEKARYNNIALLTFLERMRVERLKQIYVRGIDISYTSGFKPLETVMKTLTFIKKKDDKETAETTDTDMIQASTDIEERVEKLLKYYNDNDINIKRKYVLNVLRVSITKKSKKISLYIDKAEIVSAGENNKTERILRSFKSKLDIDLQLETAPYDIQVQNFLSNKALLITGSPLIYEKDLLNGMQTLSNIRSSIIKALSDAKRENFLTDYYE